MAISIPNLQIMAGLLIGGVLVGWSTSVWLTLWILALVLWTRAFDFTQPLLDSEPLSNLTGGLGGLWSLTDCTAWLTHPSLALLPFSGYSKGL